MRVQRLWRLWGCVLRQRSASHVISSLALLALLVTLLPALSIAQPACLPDGDVDQNGSVTAADALLVFQQALGLAQLSACQRTIADVFPQPSNPDESITASDALCIFQKALSLPSCLDTLPSSNQPPIVDAGPDQSVDAGVMVFLSGTASDPDGTIASHEWTQTGGPVVSLTGSDAATAVFVAPEVSVEETLTFRLTVTDDGGAQASDAMRVTVRPAMGPVDEASAAEVFGQHISRPIVQTKCVNCHVQGGASGNTRLVFVRATDAPDHEALNLRAFEDLLAKVADEGGGSYVLNKIQGVGHGGGVQVTPGTEEFANMQRFLGLLGEEVAPPAPVTVETLFDTVVMASPRKTLRRAALIFAGRIPTDAEYAAVESGDESVLRPAIRGLMEGPQFHEFLIRASNDRLLTDRADPMIIEPSLATEFVDFSNEDYRRLKAADASGNWRKYNDWKDRVQFGFRRAPLELIAHVVQNDLPYAEILTANYIMANPEAAAAYGASTRFSDAADPHEFRPSKIEKYYRRGNGFEEGFDPLLIATYVLDPGSLRTDYPHAGILNTNVFLKRYPSTATNRNRARARWTYYHFLGLDVEKSASRTTDPMALADTNNPTLRNPACTVCHSVLDPVAGTFQNYSDNGYYKHNWGGLDSLDELYKEGKAAAKAVQAESWADRETLVWPVTLYAGTETLRVMYANPFHDEDTGEGGLVYLDRLSVVDARGDVIASHEFEDLGPPVAHFGPCGAVEDNPDTGRNDHLLLWWGDPECAFFIDVEVPGDGSYEVEVVAWSNGYYEQYGNDGFARLSISSNEYQVGDTWYRGMRAPGFDGKLAPNPDNSVQWLARQIVADPRFAEATVKFWWPALMGSEVTRPPEDAGDAGFEGQLLAANAQGAEVTRLANGFRRGFHGGPAYNLKDLLVEIVLSKWFRADAVTDADPVRHVALRGAGARRLLTPEELARKTAALTEVQWGRTAIGQSYENRWPSALTENYRLLYGGIDSDGVTERGRDLTSVMAGVAKRHAVEVSCQVVMREFYLLPETDRWLFAGIERDMTPGLAFSTVFEIKASSQAEKETLALSRPLTAGPKSVRLTFLNKYWDEANRRGRFVRLDRLAVRDAAGRVVESRELEALDSVTDCNHPVGDHFAFHCNGSVAVPIEISTAGNYMIEVVAWADQAGSELPRLSVAVESDAADSAGTTAIKNKLVELHDKLLGVQVTPDSPDVEAAYRLFVDALNRGRASDYEWFEWGGCNIGDHLFFEGVLDNTLIQRENEYERWYDINWERVNPFLDGIDFSDSHATARAWKVVLAYLMMDDRYLYLY